MPNFEFQKKIQSDDRQRDFHKQDFSQIKFFFLFNDTLRWRNKFQEDLKSKLEQVEKFVENPLSIVSSVRFIFNPTYDFYCRRI